MGNLTQTAAFQKELLKLGSEDQLRVYETLLKVQRNSKTPGLQLKRMERHPNLWEIRVSRDIRIIAELESDDIFCYSVAHHDDALRRAGRVAGIAVDERAVIRTRAGSFSGEAFSPTASAVPARRRTGPLANLSDAELVERFGLSPDWIPTLRAFSSQDQVFASGIDGDLTEKAFWELLEIFERPHHESTGAKPVYRVPSEAIARAFVAGEIGELEYNLPASSWTIVRGGRRSPILVKGGPGSGKTLVALYRALFVLEEPLLDFTSTARRVLYITYTRQLRDDARNKVIRLRGSIPASLEIETFDTVAERLVPGLRTTYDRAECVGYAATALVATSIDPSFFMDEITDCIERRNVRTLDEYARLPRRGRGSRLSVRERAEVWMAYERYLAEIASKSVRDGGTMRMQAADRAASISYDRKYDFVIIDEVQDLPWSILAMAVSLTRGEGRAKHLMLVGDSGQSIYQSGFRWSEVGLRIGGGNVFTLGTSERNTKEILAFARAVIGNVPTDDVLTETATKSGDRPRLVHGFTNLDQRHEWLADDIAERIASGMSAQQLAIVAHGKNALKAVGGELADRGIATVEYNSSDFYRADAVKLITAHSAKGLEFAEVYVPDANAGTYPFYKNAQLPDDEREDRDAQDCKLLYVALTRAADRLTVLYDRDPSPFLASVASLAEITVIGPPAAKKRA